jgi:hypothetical protein
MFLTLDSVRETDPQVVVVKKLFSYKWIFGIIVVLNLLLPSKEEVLFIVAGTGIIELAKNEKVSEVAGNAFDVVNNYLENMKKEQEPKK